jgi:hypothetical protein
MYRAVSKLKKGVLAFAGLTVLGVLLSKSPFNRTVLAASSASSFIEFESGHVRPLAMSPDRTRLFAVNTPDGTLEVFRITPRGLVLQARVSVGMEPVAVAARNDNEIWVVNHLLDSVSIVHLSETPHVTRTLLLAMNRAISCSPVSPPALSLLQLKNINPDYSCCADRRSLLYYKHVEETLFAASTEASSCLTYHNTVFIVPQHFFQARGSSV